MRKHEGMPMWVFLAFSSIETRKAALLLILSSIIFTLYSVPWVEFFSNEPWVEKIFLIDDWSWVQMMVPIIIWYLLSLRWVDKNGEWR